MTRSIHARALALAAALGLGIAPAAMAQTAADPEMPEAMPAEQIDDAKLASFVDAAEAIRSVIDRYQPELEAESEPEARAELERSINAEIVDAVEAVDGITIEEYVQIARAARQDERLNNRILELMERG